MDLPRTLTRFLRRLLALFFVKIEVEGAEHVPRAGGGVLVAWHPNGLLDPGLLLTHVPLGDRRVVFGARSGLFSWPLLGPLLRALGTVPIYRPQDDPDLDSEARRTANRRSLDALAEAVVDGAFAALFPEGVSHDDPHPSPLRPGAARLFLRSRELARNRSTAMEPSLIPVGLHYDRKHLFGSKVLVEVHPPVEVPEEATADELTARLAEVLSDVVQATASWEEHYLMHRLRKVVRAERAHRAGARPGPASERERLLGFARVRAGYEALRRTRPEETEALRQRVRAYDEDLRALGLEDHELDARADLGSPWQGPLLAAQAVGIYLLLPPLLILGYVVNVPVALALGALARRLGAQRKDEATLKLLLGAVVFPAVWLTLALLAAWGNFNLHERFPGLPQLPHSPLWAGIATFLLCSVGGWVAVRYLRLARATLRALAVRLTRAARRRTVARLRAERAALFGTTMEVSMGLDLPGVVAPDGRVLSPAVELGMDDLPARWGGGATR